ncbi:MAG: hypothetical protein M1405_01385 [Patescibacteria group bacterium]|nr:hypothetical protein [Patescibacteria group bacterium]
MPPDRKIKVIPEELRAYHQDLARDYIHSSTQDAYEEARKQDRTMVLHQWDLASEAEPRIINFRGPNGSMIIPYADLHERIVDSFEKDRDPELYGPTFIWEDVSISDAEELDSLPEGLREYWEESVLAFVLTYKLATPGRGVKQITYYSGAHFMKMLAERWMYVNSEEAPLKNDWSKPFIASGKAVNEGPAKLNGIFLPVFPKPIFSRN